ncbi:MAG: RraA family protein [Paracoccus sp. (in: a-proteobacteria)]|uniref:RraA family protein n=1 Tax=Paracoccus sp. TaxID=267 RepID=UPI0026E0BC9C|nr:RraA family protein [Paracoccus sp. (in: a-proteobacteria)]MDO5631606.1 RraA family protein [Paracoccus sp. (in: a-proteobacteria)]
MSEYGEFTRLGTALVSDILDEAGYHNQTLDPSIAGVGQVASFCGAAICVQGQRRVNTVNPPADAATMPLYQLPMLVSGPAVLVLATNSFRGGAVTGGLLAEELRQAGCVAVVTDGLVRDLNELAATGLAVRAAGAIPLNGARRFILTGWNMPVSLPTPEGGGVTIHPGDLILGDMDGTVIVPQAVASQILTMGRELERRESRLRKDSMHLSAPERAAARANRMSHVLWLRGQKEMAP